MTGTGRRRRVSELEASYLPEPDDVQAWLGRLSQEELEALLVAVLRRDGHPDPEGEAARRCAEIKEMPTEDLLKLAGYGDDGETDW